MSKDADQSYPQMAEVCIFGGSAEGGRPFAQGSRGCNSPGRSPEVKPLGRVQGDNACSGVQRVKPLAQ